MSESYLKEWIRKAEEGFLAATTLARRFFCNLDSGDYTR